MIGALAFAAWVYLANPIVNSDWNRGLLMAAGDSDQETLDRVSKREELIRRKLKDRESGSGIAAPTPADGVSSLNMIFGQIETADRIAFRVGSRDGNMLKISNTATGKKFGIVMSTIVESPESKDRASGSGNLARKTRAEMQFEVHAFELTGPAQAENVIETGKETRFLGKPYSGPEYQITIVDFLPELGLPNTSASASCCVSCGTYRICGATVTSSCGTCSADGPQPPPKP